MGRCRNRCGSGGSPVFAAGQAPSLMMLYAAAYTARSSGAKKWHMFPGWSLALMEPRSCWRLDAPRPRVHPKAFLAVVSFRVGKGQGFSGHQPAGAAEMVVRAMVKLSCNRLDQRLTQCVSPPVGGKVQDNQKGRAVGQAAYGTDQTARTR